MCGAGERGVVEQFDQVAVLSLVRRLPFVLSQGRGLSGLLRAFVP